MPPFDTAAELGAAVFDDVAFDAVIVGDDRRAARAAVRREREADDALGFDLEHLLVLFRFIVIEEHALRGRKESIPPVQRKHRVRYCGGIDLEYAGLVDMVERGSGGHDALLPVHRRELCDVARDLIFKLLPVRIEIGHGVLAAVEAGEAVFELRSVALLRAGGKAEAGCRSEAESEESYCDLSDVHTAFRFPAPKGTAFSE